MLFMVCFKEPTPTASSFVGADPTPKKAQRTKILSIGI